MNLIATIRKKLPDFERMCADDSEHVLLHQDASAADYQEEEYLLIGTAKYAGLRGEGSARDWKESEHVLQKKKKLQ